MRRGGWTAVLILAVFILAGAGTALQAAPESAAPDPKLEAITAQLARLEEAQKKILEKLDQLAEEHRQLRYMVHKR